MLYLPVQEKQVFFHNYSCLLDILFPFLLTYLSIALLLFSFGPCLTLYCLCFADEEVLCCPSWKLFLLCQMLEEGLFQNLPHLNICFVCILSTCDRTHVIISLHDHLFWPAHELCVQKVSSEHKRNISFRCFSKCLLIQRFQWCR